MVDLTALFSVFATLLAMACGVWWLSVVRRNASIVDSFWSLFFLAGTWVYVQFLPDLSARAQLLLLLVTVWALRLAGHITWRNWGEPEDRRYQAIRARNEPGYTWKSLYLVFGLQALLAFSIAIPLFAGLGSNAPLSILDIAGVLLWIVGFGFEAIGDWQLARFKANPASRGKVLDTGLWRYTRHPNYFGEAMLWWGYYLIAVAAGGWWTVFAPLLMTFLLLKVSGVTLLEQDIGERRPAYRDYIVRTNAFLPGRPKEAP
jgi:steroid 5-alpha reductase family enzyme